MPFGFTPPTPAPTPEEFEAMRRSLGGGLLDIIPATAPYATALFGPPETRMAGPSTISRVGPVVRLPEILQRLFGSAMRPKATPPQLTGLTRPWPGVYRGAVEQGRMQPKSFANPLTFEMPPISDAERAALLRSLGMTGP